MAALRAARISDCLLGAAAGIAWLPVLGKLSGARRLSHPRGLSAIVDLSFVLKPAVLVALSCAFVVCVVSWSLRRRPASSAALAFLLFALVGHVENSLYAGDSGVHHGKLLPAAALLAWAVVWRLTRAQAVQEREQHAHEAVLGVAAACYVLAALAKLQSGGLDWVNSSNIPLLMAERAIGATAWLETIRNFLATVGAGAGGATLSLVALLIELFGVGLLWKSTRRWAAALLLGLHLAIALLLGYVYVAWMLLLLAVLVRPAATRPAT